MVDLRFSRSGVKLRAVKQEYMRYSCWNCKHSQMELPPEEKYGINLQSYIIYHAIDLRISFYAVARILKTLFALDLDRNPLSRIKTLAACRYFSVYQGILQRITVGRLVHADETQVRIGSDVHYVWVFTNHTEVAYVHTPTREAGIVRDLLVNFTGVLVSDFYSGYDGVKCAQQKCLIHLLRDINDDVLKNPFNDEMRQVALNFLDFSSRLSTRSTDVG